jgi:hypothetical protein
VNLIHRRGAEDAEFPQREVTERVIAAALEVHTGLGPGLLESVYHHAMARELELRGIEFESQVAVPLRYKEDIHRAQRLTYLRLSGLEAGLLINFNTALLRQGLKRVVNTLRDSASSAPLR